MLLLLLLRLSVQFMLLRPTSLQLHSTESKKFLCQGQIWAIGELKAIKRGLHRGISC
jgi:hypothetical protein